MGLCDVSQVTSIIIEAVVVLIMVFPFGGGFHSLSGGGGIGGLFEWDLM